MAKKKGTSRKTSSKKSKSSSKTSKKSSRSIHKKNKVSSKKKTPPKTSTIIATVVALIALVLLYLYVTDDLFPSEDIVATVDGYDISQEELNMNYEIEVPPQYRTQISKYSYLQDSLIPQTLIFIEAEKMGITFDKIATRQRFDELLEETGVTLDLVIQQLDIQGITFDQYLNVLAKKLTVTEFLNQTAAIEEVTDENAKQFYDQNKNLLFTQEGVILQYEDVKEEIRFVLETENRRLAFASYVVELQEDADIKINLKPEPSALESDTPVLS